MLSKLFASSPCMDCIHICQNQTDAVVSCLPYSVSHGCVGKCVPESPHSGSAAALLVMVCICSLQTCSIAIMRIDYFLQGPVNRPSSFLVHKTPQDPLPPPISFHTDSVCIFSPSAHRDILGAPVASVIIPGFLSLLS